MGIDVKASGYGEITFSMGYGIYRDFIILLIKSLYDEEFAERYSRVQFFVPARSVLGEPHSAAQADLIMLIESRSNFVFKHELCARLCDMFKKTRGAFEENVKGDVGWMRVYDYFVVATQMGSEGEDSYMKFS